MKNIIITTFHKNQELKKFNLIENVWAKKEKNDCKILAIYTPELPTIPKELQIEINSLVGDIVLLYHRDYYEKINDLRKISTKFDCGTGNKIYHQNYLKLIEEIDSFNVFDEVWQYFIEQSKTTVPFDSKLELLHQIYSGKFLSDIKLKEELREYHSEFEKMKDRIGSHYEKQYAQPLIDFRNIILKNI